RVTIRWYEGNLPPEVRQQIEQLSNAWLKSKAGKNASETGFSTGRLDELNAAVARAELLASIPPLSNDAQHSVPRFVTAVAMTGSGQLCAFTTFTPVYGSPTIDETGPESPAWGWTLDMMRRRSDAPPGVIELLLVRSIERFRSRGAHILSLGLVAWSDTRQEMTPAQRQIVSFITDHLHLLGSHSSLFKFKQKFSPRWESRYIVASGTLALPKIALAVFSARNYAGGGVMRLVK
ncbi:MAG TPA: phosphatidylglycerol lysyltransferase domain-containing protein, partial [Ktedonobacteraceae bacterium]|nr:phosphatidylglycerol lysyltransferase domain-containing protein [Ktedonobacteraceae bacterium]